MSAHSRLDQRGMAVIIALFMTVMVTALVAAMTHVARTETISSSSYTSVSQARYAAESGVAAAARYLLSDAYEQIMPGSAADPLSNYNMTVSPVLTAGGQSIVLSTDPNVPSNYPNANVVTAFQAGSTGTLDVVDGTVTYGARATLIAMRQIPDGITGLPMTLQTWEITGVGRRTAALGSGEVEVTAVIDRTTRPVFNYAAFATSAGCSALTFTGNASTRSYDSRIPVPSGSTPTTTNNEGHVGTNGNLSGGGSADVNGTLSTPMAGVGACTAQNVTAATVAGLGTVSEGLIQLPQPIEFPTPPTPNPLPPTTDMTINGNTCPSGYGGICAASGSMTTWTPVDANTPVLMGNVTLSGNATVYLKAGTYHMNSLTITGNTRIMVDSSSGGPVKIVLAGEGSVTHVLDVTGNGIGNMTWDPTLLRFEYAGNKIMEFDGNGDTSALVYAPNAQGRFWGNADFFGSVIMRQMDFGGNTRMTYDRALQATYLTAGNPVMTSFSWRTF